MSRTRVCLFLAIAVGCSRTADTPPPTTDVGPVYPLTVADGLGRTVTIPRRPERIVSLAPAMTETLFAVGAGPRVVAVTTADSYPPEVKQLPTVGGFTPKTLSTEAVLAQRPDLVVLTGGIQKPLAEPLEKMGLTVLAFEPKTLEATADMIEQVGRVTDCDARAAEVTADFRRRLAAVRERSAAATSRPKVLYVLWDDPLQTAGPGTFVGRMIAEAGGENVFGDAAQQYPRVSDEVVLQRQPDLIITPDHGNVGLPTRLATRPPWQQLRAVREKRIHTVSEDLVNRAGPRLIDGLEAVEKLVREAR